MNKIRVWSKGGKPVAVPLDLPGIEPGHPQ